jgi:hypothetical protein
VAHVVETFVRWRIVPLKRWDFLHLQRDPWPEQWINWRLKPLFWACHLFGSFLFMTFFISKVCSIMLHQKCQMKKLLNE